MNWSCKICKRLSLVNGNVFSAALHLCEGTLWKGMWRPSILIVGALGVRSVEKFALQEKLSQCTIWGDIKCHSLSFCGNFEINQLDIVLSMLHKHITIFLGLDTLIEDNMQKDSTGTWFCLQCSFSSRKSSNVRTHVESKHVKSGGFQCLVCSYICPTREAFRKHMTRMHKPVDND